MSAPETAGRASKVTWQLLERRASVPATALTAAHAGRTRSTTMTMPCLPHYPVSPGRRPTSSMVLICSCATNAPWFPQSSSPPVRSGKRSRISKLENACLAAETELEDVRFTADSSALYDRFSRYRRRGATKSTP